MWRFGHGRNNSWRPGRGGGGTVTVEAGPKVDEARLRASAEAGIGDLIESTVMLQRQLVAHEAVCRRILADVREDMPVASLLPDVQADNWRSAVTAAIQGFEITRHRLRLVLVAMSVDEGMSIAEVARNWGVSRQLASRWVQESTALRA